MPTNEGCPGAKLSHRPYAEPAHRADAFLTACVFSRRGSPGPSSNQMPSPKSHLTTNLETIIINNSAKSASIAPQFRVCRGPWGPSEGPLVILQEDQLLVGGLLRVQAVPSEIWGLLLAR